MCGLGVLEESVGTWNDGVVGVGGGGQERALWKQHVLENAGIE